MIRGLYLPNPDLQLRTSEDWQPVYEALKLDWVDKGTGTDEMFSVRPAGVVAKLRERLTASEPSGPLAPEQVDPC